MLEEIVVTNLGLIPNASITPAEGLTVITGETGAGKTVMLGALRLLIGESASRGLIGPHGDEAEVSARFVGETEIVVRRVVTSTRSKAYLSGAISTAAALRQEIGPRVSIVGQNDQHMITSSRGVRRLVDQLLTEGERPRVAEYESAWSALETVQREADLLGSDHRALERELETVRFQMEEIDAAGFAPGDDEELRGRVVRLRNAESLAAAIHTALHELTDDGAGGHIATALRALEDAMSIDPSLSDITRQVTESSTALSALAGEIARYASDLEMDPGRLDETEQRIALLGSLKRKYGDSLEDIETFRKNAGVREQEISTLLTSAGAIAERLEEATSDLNQRGDALREARINAANRLADAAHSHLTELGFATPVVAISVTRVRAGPKGADSATVLFASDESLQPAPVAAIASGGELSRLVLALTLASGSADVDLVAFDEIDSGIGGATALAMGKKLASLSNDRQVIGVTHLPQVAAFADRHFVVRRSGATTTIVEVRDGQRIEELARMLAGLSASEKGREHATELLAIAAAQRAP